MIERLKRLSIKGIAWSAGESVGVALFSIVVFTLLARILEPQDFGVVALAGAFVLTLNLVIGHSFADAIVQRATIDDDHVETAFWTNLLIALLLVWLCHAGAGTVAGWLGEPRLAEILPALSWVLPLNALGVVQMALLRREARFRAIAIRSVLARAVGGSVGVVMAFGGFGAWSLVGQQLSGGAVAAIAMIVVSPWRPRFRYSLSRFRDLWRFGFHVSASQLVSGIGEQALNLIVGSLFGSVILGYFAIAWRVTQLVRSLVGSAVYHVGFNAFSRLQDDRTAVARAFLQATRLSCLAGFPIGAGLAVLAGPLVLVMFGEKWENSIPLVGIFAFELFVAFYAMFFTACYRAMGNAGWVLGLSVLYVGTGLAAVMALSPLGIQAVAAAWVAKSVVLLPVQVALLHRMLEVSVRDLVRPVLPPLSASVIMAALLSALVGLGGEEIPAATLLLIGVPSGAMVYALSVFLISPDLLRVALRTARIMVSPEGASRS
jgi:O-antigen/teichoic acid export membrane protein